MRGTPHLVQITAVAAMLSILGCAKPAPLKVSYPRPNPYLNDSIYPISHGNPAQTDGTLVRGPTQGKALAAQDVGAIYSIFTANPTIRLMGNDTVAYASAVSGINKLLLTGEAFELIGSTPYPGHRMTPPRAVEAFVTEIDMARRGKDDAGLLGLAARTERYGLTRESLADGRYSAIDRDGLLYCVFGGTSLGKLTDGGEVRAPLRLVTSVNLAEVLPPEVVKGISRLTGLSMTYDGYLVAAASGLVIVLDRDLNVRSYVTLPGESVDNNIAVDEANGIYVVTSKKMRKLVWTGMELSTDPANGAWEADYPVMEPEKARSMGAMSRGSGTTPTLMGFGEDPDKLVLIADADEQGSHLIAFWRDAIPADFAQKPGTSTRRIADRIALPGAKLTVETSVAVLDYGAVLLNTTYPEDTGDFVANSLLSGLTRKPPMGMYKLEWNPNQRSFTTAWQNTEIDNSDMAVPVISAPSRLVYAATRKNGQYQYVAVDWQTGAIRARWTLPVDSALWNAYFSALTLLADGDLMVGGLFAVKRLDVGQ